jgi:dihydrolipoamide dehydrogenase
VTTSSSTEHRILIIGGGPGGYEAARAGRQLGAEVILIEDNGIGGNAVLTDVVPSKTLIATAEAAQRVAQAQSLGVTFSIDKVAVQPKIEIDLEAVNRRLLALAKSQSEDMLETLKNEGVRVISGRGRLDGNHHVIVEPTLGGAPERIEAKTIIVAVGAHPREVPGSKPDGDRIFTWKQLYNLKTLPEHMIVVGSGVTGAEFASAYLQLGSKVTLISSRDKVLPGNDADAAELIEDVFRRGGMQILNKSRAVAVVNTGSGVRVTLEGGQVVEGSHCLMAVGAIPNTEGLGLEEAGVKLTDSGHVIANKVARTSRAANVFTAPEIASVGWSQAEIEQGLVRGEIQEIQLDTNPRAKMYGIREGFIKLFASIGSGTVIGGVVVAPSASDLIYPIAVAIENRLTVDQLARTYTVYPSLSGSIAEAASALHQPID